MGQLTLGKMRIIHTERVENEYMYVNTSRKERIQTEENLFEKGKQQKQR